MDLCRFVDMCSRHPSPIVDVKALTFHNLDAFARVQGFADWAHLRNARRHQIDTPDAVVLRYYMREKPARGPSLILGKDFTIVFEDAITDDDLPF